MPLFVWSEKFSVNIKELDDQHKNLINMINTLHDAMSEGRGRQVMGKLLDDLIEYAGYHFSSEENLMTKYNFPELDKHKEEHEKFKTKVLAFQKEHAAGKATVSIEVMIFLKDWLDDHLLNTDRKYTPFLNERGVF